MCYTAVIVKVSGDRVPQKPECRMQNGELRMKNGKAHVVRIVQSATS